MTLKSKTLAAGDFDLGRMAEDTKALAQMDQGACRALIEWMNAAPDDRETVAARLLAEEKISAPDFATGRRVLEFLAHNDDDPVEILVGDLIENANVQGKERKSLAAILAECSPSIVAHRNHDAIEQALRVAMPAYSSIVWSANLRLVRISSSQQALLPVAIVKIDTDENAELSFQVDGRGLDELLRELTLLKKELIAASEQAKGLDSGSERRPSRAPSGEK